MNPRYSLALVALLLIGGAIALWLQDRAPQNAPDIAIASERPAPISSSAPAPDEAPAPEQAYTFAISWHPAFCEARPNLPECRDQSSSDFEARNLVLHGLWPEDEYCGVSPRLIDLDGANRWDDLPDIDVSDATWRDLTKIMPGVEDNLHRHEWLFHGTCSGASADTYFRRAKTLLDEVNNSAVGDLLARNIGNHVSRNQIRAAFDAAFGNGAGRKVRVDCADDGDRTLLAELRINIEGDAMGAASFADLIRAGRNAGTGCAGGVLDRVGTQ